MPQTASTSAHFPIPVAKPITSKLFVKPPSRYCEVMTESAMHQWHEQRRARFGDLFGSEIVRDYGDVRAEYDSLHKGAGLLDLSFRGRVCLAGSDRVRFLHGQVTNDVKKLREGEGCYAALVTAKGKIESDLNIYCLKDELLLDFEPGLIAKHLARFDKFIIADDVQVTDVSPHYGLLSVQGPQAESVVRNSGVAIAVPQQPLSFTCHNQPQPGDIYCMRISRGPTIGFDLFLPTAGLRDYAEKLTAAGARSCGWDALEIVRIEAGLPRFGQDMDETNLAPEAGIEQRAISYTKGCYIGQEVISRIRAYGQVAKLLRGLRWQGTADRLPKKGDKILMGDKEAGFVTSAVHSPLLEANLGLGYVRRESNEIGTELIIRSNDQSIHARIVPLPFVST
jgi:folate-binding protein YgfZ